MSGGNAKWGDSDRARELSGQSGAAAQAAQAAPNGGNRKWEDLPRSGDAQRAQGSNAAWRPELIQGGAQAREPESRATSPQAPREQQILSGLALKAGSKEQLRAKLSTALSAFSAFCFGLFDAALFEATAAEKSAVQQPSAISALGLAVECVDGGRPKIVSVAPGSPAEAAGLLPGQEIIQVDDFQVSTVGLLEEALRAGLWTSHAFVYKHDGAQGKTIVRAPEAKKA